MSTELGFYLPSFRVGGAEKVVINLANEFSRRGYSVDLLVREDEGELRNNVNSGLNIIKTEYISFPPYAAFGEVPFLRKYFKGRSPNIFYSPMNHINIPIILAHETASTSTKLTISEHNDPELLWQSSWKNRMVYRLAKRLYPRADQIVAVSDGVAQNLSTIVGIPRHQIATIYNPVVTDDMMSRTFEQTGHKWFDSEEFNVILSVGRLNRQKRFEDLIRAFAKDEQPASARLVIIGQGPERRNLEKEIADHGLSNKIEIIDYVEDIYTYMHHASVFALSSAWEGFGNVLVEALACGCPVVSTNCPSGPAEILQDGQYGKLVPVGDPAALSDAIQNTLGNEIDSEYLQRRAEDFRVKTIVDQYEKLFEPI